MKKITIILLACLMLMGVSTLAFSADKVKFTYVNFIGKENDQVGCTIETYLKTHPNVEIEYQIIEHETMQQKYQVMQSSNSMPDMYWWNAIYLAKELEDFPGTSIDLTPYYDKAFKDKFIDGTFNLLATGSGKIGGFPAEAQVQAWMFNKKLFDQFKLKIPTTYDELKACVPVFKKNGIATIAYGTKDPWPSWGFYHWFQLWGIDDQAVDLFQKHSIKTKDAGWVNGLKAIGELADLGAYPADNATINFEAMVQMFLAGKAAIIQLPSDQLGKIVGTPNEKDYVFNWGVKFTKSPYNQNQGIKMIGNGYGIGSGVAKDPAKLKAIIDFNKWRYTEPAFKLALDKGFILPVKMQYDKSKLSPVNKQQAELIGDSRKGTITATYAPYRVWKWNVDLITDWYNIEDNCVNSLANGSMKLADLDAEFVKIDASIDNAIKTLGLK
jgi:raffinose/stachyose/melibiose transport system substrate-binding protein